MSFIILIFSIYNSSYWAENLNNYGQLLLFKIGQGSTYIVLRVSMLTNKQVRLFEVITSK
jgi:hypothetical protein